MTLADSNRLAWSIHNAAADRARSLGACHRCAIEAGCRATDDAGMSRRAESSYEMHALCARRIEGAK